LFSYAICGSVVSYAKSAKNSKLLAADVSAQHLGHSASRPEGEPGNQ
jgi:hypothetical protein